MEFKFLLLRLPLWMLGKAVMFIVALPPIHLKNLCTPMVGHTELSLVPTILEVTISTEVVWKGWPEIKLCAPLHTVSNLDKFPTVVEEEKNLVPFSKCK